MRTRSGTTGRWWSGLVMAVSGLAALATAPDTATATPSGDLALRAELDRAVLAKGERQSAFLRISLIPARREGVSRAPMNVALVIDRSGSMSSQARMESARRAAMLAVDRLGRDDILSVVSYDDRVEVLVPATKVLDAADVKARIARLAPRGSTAIHAGVLAGAAEVRKFKSPDRVNRIVLISDGLANVGPSKPSDFVSLGRELQSEGITVSTIGLGNGYNEDLMAGLARAADGGHVFVQESADLAQFMAREFDDAQSTVGQDAEIIIRTRDGVRPLRSLGREASVDGRRMTFKVGALFGGVEQILVAELDVEAAAALGSEPLATVEVRYTRAGSGDSQALASSVAAEFADKAASEKSVNAIVMRDVAALVSRAARQEAVSLRDAGKSEEAVARFKANAEYLRRQSATLPGGATYAPLVDELKASEEAASPAAQTSEGWSKARKSQRAYDSNKFGAGQKY